ncbi:MAG TPA: hypothetical protein VFR23_24815 [Jiangellaceae bacterium]|nr:hypothetical protein [Jiangellaceae bacterium]
MNDSSTATGLVSGDPTAEKTKRPRLEERFDADLEAFLLMGDSWMGERGTLAGTIAQLEHGGPFTGVPNTDLYSDQQIGWHKTVVGLVERHRWLSAAWAMLTREERHRLTLWYHAPPAAFRSDEGFGARDKCPAVEEITKYGAAEPSKPNGLHNRKGTEARLGRAAALALWICESPNALLNACQDPNKGKHSRVISRALRAAEEAATVDHRAWRAAKDEASKPRKPSERRALLPEFRPGESEQ